MVVERPDQTIVVTGDDLVPLPILAVELNNLSAVEVTKVRTTGRSGANATCQPASEIGIFIKFGGNAGSAWKASKVVGYSIKVESSDILMRNNMSAKRTGRKIWRMVCMARRFWRSQFFQRRRRNCEQFEADIAVRRGNEALLKTLPEQLQLDLNLVAGHCRMELCGVCDINKGQH